MNFHILNIFQRENTIHTSCKIFTLQQHRNTRCRDPTNKSKQIMKYKVALRWSLQCINTTYKYEIHPTMFVRSMEGILYETHHAWYLGFLNAHLWKFFSISIFHIKSLFEYVFLVSNQNTIMQALRIALKLQTIQHVDVRIINP